MNKKNSLIILTVIFALACGLYFFSTDGTDSDQESKNRLEAKQAGKQNPPPAIESASPADEPETEYHKKNLEAPLPHPKGIEEIKKQIYDLNIEYVEDIPQLDRVVQTGNAPTKDFWLGGWVGVDDFKEEANGFKLEPQDDGTFIFYPDEKTARTYTFFETPKTYTYDPDKKEFFWEIDYYGKTISHRARFINENVLVTMLISGRKVAMDIYQKQPDQTEGE